MSEFPPSSAEFESAPDAYSVKLDSFEGPLDLLIHLIKKNEVNIYDIPIALITQQYLEYIEMMKELNLDTVGEFLVMAATLIHIKSKMLLPRPESASEGEPEEDPREALVRRLLEHQKFKAAAELLHERAVLRGAQWIRPDGRVAEIAGDDYAYEPEVEVDLFSLLAAFRGVLERAKQRPKMLLPPEEVPVEVRIDQLLAMLSETEACGFEDLFAKDDTRRAMIVTFLALLEMIRLKLIRVFQTAAFGPIRVYKRARPADAPTPIGDPETNNEKRKRKRIEPMSDELKPIIEALIFASPDPLTPKMLFKLLESEPKEDVEAALEALKRDYDRPGGLQLVEVAGGYQIVTKPELHEWVRRLFHERTTQRLSVQALETLAVIAYKQPITAPEITEIRGVNTAGVINTLIERQLVKIVGRKQVVGRPFMYATTREFLIRFGLRDLSDLPKIEEMAEALGFEVPAGLTQPSAPQAQLDLLDGTAALGEMEPMSTDVEPGEKIH
jgi:segregation and condensation protein A